MEEQLKDANHLNDAYIAFYDHALESYRNSPMYDEKHLELFEAIVRDVFEKNISRFA
jgi:hypothetical protein